MSDPAASSNSLQNGPISPAQSDTHRSLAIITYVLFLVGWPTLHMATLAGVILAYVQKSDARGTIWESHYDAAISTFWVCLVLGLAALPLCLIAIGFLIYPVLIVWFLYRVIRGLVHAIDNRPY